MANSFAATLAQIENESAAARGSIRDGASGVAPATYDVAVFPNSALALNSA